MGFSCGYNVEYHDELKFHLHAAMDYGILKEQIIGVFLYGSQNYGIDLPTSDVDTKVIFVPTLEQAVLEPMVVKELHLENGEHCELMDIRHFCKNLLKQNINFTEILYTEHYLLNNDWEKLWQTNFIDYRDEIVRYDVRKTVLSICDQAIHTLKQNPTNGKKVANGLRLKIFLEKYVKYCDYEECLKPKYPTILKMLKATEKVDECLAKQLIKDFEELKDFEMSCSNGFMEWVPGFLDRAIISFIRLYEQRRLCF